MKFEIMLSILFDLLSKKCVTAKYLSEKNEVSIRSIYRYISSLEMAGVPLYTIRGNNGGISIVDQYRLPSTFMTVKEFEQTISALNAIIEGVPDKTLLSAVNKLKATVKNEYTSFDIQGGNLIIDAGPWGDTIGYKSKLSLIQKSIDELNILKITYHDRNGEVSEREIEPHIILFKQGIWYIYAYCHLRNTFRLFKIGRINKIIVQNEKFIRKQVVKDNIPLDYWEKNIQAEDIEMEIDKSIFSDIEEWLGVENVKENNGKILAKAKLPYDKGLISKIISYGNKIKVIYPKKLKEDIYNNAQEIIKMYK